MLLVRDISLKWNKLLGPFYVEFAAKEHSRYNRIDGNNLDETKTKRIKSINSVEYANFDSIMHPKCVGQWES